MPGTGGFTATPSLQQRLALAEKAIIRLTEEKTELYDALDGLVLSLDLLTNLGETSMAVATARRLLQ